jgi:hypothetical protein
MFCREGRLGWKRTDFFLNSPVSCMGERPFCGPLANAEAHTLRGLSGWFFPRDCSDSLHRKMESVTIPVALSKGL